MLHTGLAREGVTEDVCTDNIVALHHTLHHHPGCHRSPPHIYQAPQSGVGGNKLFKVGCPSAKCSATTDSMNLNDLQDGDLSPAVQCPTACPVPGRSEIDRPGVSQAAVSILRSRHMSCSRLGGFQLYWTDGHPAQL